MTTRQLLLGKTPPIGASFDGERVSIMLAGAVRELDPGELHKLAHFLLESRDELMRRETEAGADKPASFYGMPFVFDESVEPGTIEVRQASGFVGKFRLTAAPAITAYKTASAFVYTIGAKSDGEFWLTRTEALDCLTRRHGIEPARAAELLRDAEQDEPLP